MGMISSYGLCQLLGFFFTSMHGILPFLLLGVGVDDMFVIIQSFDNLSEEEQQDTLANRFGATMKHAGVAITITSVTDLLAFFIGGTTIIPALASFCVYAAFGILFIYFYQTTFFLAWLTIDQRRVDDRRDGCLCWRQKSADWSPTTCSRWDLLGWVFNQLGNILATWIGKTVVLLVTAAMLGVGLYGTVTLSTKFDYSEWVEEGTYLRRYIAAQRLHFPSEGDMVQIITTDLNYHAADLASLDAIVNTLLDDMEGTVDRKSVESWVKPFINHTNTVRGYTGTDKLPGKADYNQQMFVRDLTGFLTSPGGGVYRSKFEFDETDKKKVRKYT